MISQSNVNINFLNHEEDEDDDDNYSGDDVHHDASINDRKNDDNKCSIKSLSCGQQQQQQQQQLQQKQRRHKEQKISDFKILTKKTVQHINVGFIEIGDCFEKINQCASLRSITITIILLSYHKLEVLNKLKRIDKINVNFFLELNLPDDEPEILPEIPAITFKFKTLLFETEHYSGDNNKSFNFN
ncbi:hypothetical protein CYY_008331 [Polysphondylium violaceum]|uniref:Uncharacterized protein n=1 Tax=Polysphondylium violaceum TaxID=133409 RepID=A0A8J4PN84_9MYCE|nr:hypothetical protein CYY_008331 [Polysphondylium violaceum]